MLWRSFRCAGRGSLLLQGLFNIGMVRIEDAPADWESRGGVGHAMMTGRVGLLSLIVGILPGWLFADEAGAACGRLHPSTSSRCLSKRCYACHGALQQKAGLRLDTAALMKKGGDSGSAIEPGSSGESLIIDAVTGAQRLAHASRKRGVAPFGRRDRPDQGLDRPGGQEPPRTSVPQPDPRRHWSFQPLIRPEVPSAAALGEPRDGSATRLTRSWPQNIASTG